MKLALIFGSQGEKLKARLETLKDNLSIECYVSIPAFIDSSLKRDLLFDRVVILSTLTDDVTLRDLNYYWKSNCMSTEVVFLCREGVDEEVAKSILNIFLSTNVATMLVKSTTYKVLSEAIILSPSKITELYGIEKYMSIELGGDEVEYKEPEKVASNESEVQKVDKEEKEPKKKEKKGFLGGIFGRKKKTVEEMANEMRASQAKKSAKLEPVEEEEKEDSTQLKVDITTDSDVDRSELEEEAQNEAFEPTIPEESMVDDTDFEMSTDDSSKESPSYAEEVELADEDNFKNSNVNVDSPSSTDEVLHEVEENEFEQDKVDADFGDLTLNESDLSSAMYGSLAGVAEVEQEGDIISTSEDGNTRVVTKVITKEVVRHTGGMVGNTLSSILSGRTNKTIIVTGDRGSGVTVTAYSLARKFAEHVPVLYFDCDIERHGLLSYIDYDTFRAYDRTMTEGIKRCRDTSIFTNCIVQYDTNLDFLTSDFSCDASDDDIKKAHAVVAENSLDYGVVIVDCPVSKLHLIPDLVLIGNTVVCMESSKRGVMNMLCGLEDSSLEIRYKRCILSRGTLLATKCNKRIKTNRVIEYADNIFADTGCNWLRMSRYDFNGKLTDELLTEIVEG